MLCSPQAPLPIHVMRRSRNLVVLDGLAIADRGVSNRPEPSAPSPVLLPSDAERTPNEVHAS